MYFQIKFDHKMIQGIKVLLVRMGQLASVANAKKSIFGIVYIHSKVAVHSDDIKMYYRVNSNGQCSDTWHVLLAHILLPVKYLLSCAIKAKMQKKKKTLIF